MVVHFLAGTSFQTIFLWVISVANIAKTSSSTCTWVLRASYNQRSLRCTWYSLISCAESDDRVLHGSIPFGFLTSADDLCWYLLVVWKWSMVFVTFECTALLITVQTPQPSTLSLWSLKSCWINISCSRPISRIRKFTRCCLMMLPEQVEWHDNFFADVQHTQTLKSCDVPHSLVDLKWPGLDLRKFPVRFDSLFCVSVVSNLRCIATRPSHSRGLSWKCVELVM